ncbi:MAG TPA: tetratricopeptide repeat protein [Candidatus Omnitrophota bacterium]|nr:tetratricopeptide repeat protein [Candidatus Omnitrophota bacterium]
MQKNSSLFNFTRLGYWFLAIGTLVLYAPAVFFQFIYYDDNEYVFENARLQAGLSLSFVKWAFTTFHFSNWHPLNWLSYAIDWELYGFWAGGYHATNILFHTANVLLVFFLFSRITRSPAKSFLIAALFAWHPVRVESVAWISERKDVLSTFFVLLSVIAYAKFVSFEEKRKRLFYFLTLFLFICSLMSKPMYVTLPVILLFFDFWPFERTEPWLKRLAEKIPFALLSAASSYVTIKAQSLSGAIHHFADYPYWVRFANIAQAYWDYIFLFLWPAKLSIFYPYFPNAHVGRSLLIALILILITLVLFLQRKKQPALWVGWAFFGIMLFPVTGVITIGSHWITCRYLYGPAIGLSLVAIWGIASLLPKIRLPKTVVHILAASVLAGYFISASIYLTYWQNSHKLFQHALETIPRNWVAHVNLRAAYGRDGDHDKAAEHLIQAIKIFPDVTNRIPLHWLDFYYMGKAYWNRGQIPQAQSFFKETARRIAEAKPEELHPRTEATRRGLANCIISIDAGRPQDCVFEPVTEQPDLSAKS